MRTRIRVVVRGTVQGVFFRVRCAEQARRRGVAGFVRNLSDGGVEAVFEGPSKDVDAMVRWCHSGPPLARVERVDVTALEPSGEEGFRVR